LEQTQSAYQDELKQLKKTTEVMDEQLHKIVVTPRYYGQDLTEQVLDFTRETKREQLQKAIAEPYFGRLDYQEVGKSQPSPLYIGKIGVEHAKTNELLVIDWRAPVASLFYSFTGGTEEAAYESPEDGIISGHVLLKRNLVIRQQVLQRVVDTYDRDSDAPAVADEFLLYRLGENKDNRLRDIVSTIQAEQDQIIRSVRNTAIVIQGVAGSGKTTVALHRLAFLLYQYRDNIRAERMIIFAPNSMFLDYISGVLPELGVGHIQQTIFQDWALALLDNEVKLTDSTKRLAYWFAIGAKRPLIDNQAPGRFKGSINFLNYIDEKLKQFEAGWLPAADLVAWDDKTLLSKTIHEWFYVENKHYPLMKRRDRTVARMKRWIEIELTKFPSESLRKEYKKKANDRLRAYLKQWPEESPVSFYKTIFAEPQVPEDLIKESSLLFKKKEVQPEDLAPLIYIHNRFYGIESEQMFDHVVIDEAQDFSPFQVALLKEQTRGGSFTILGDLSQGIHAYQGIWSWDEISSLFEADRTMYHQLDRSYRSTMEIIHFANAVLSRSRESITPAIPVFRSGEKVRLIQLSDEQQKVEALLKAVGKLQESGLINTIAIVGRTEQECSLLHEALTHRGLSATLIQAGQREYRGGISVLPVYLTKGLEFDAVLIVDADPLHYEQNFQDAKLLYVGCTRALHELWLFYTGDASPLVANLLYNEEVNNGFVIEERWL
jgi:DNA helicase-2/ATP-dependent DNA helicase PcrA